jgi:WD40 repeat protein
MFERRNFIKNNLDAFIPTVITNLISEYDYHVNGKCELTLEGHTDRIEYCNFLSNGRELRLISASEDHLSIVSDLNIRQCNFSIINLFCSFYYFNFP